MSILAVFKGWEPETIALSLLVKNGLSIEQASGLLARLLRETTDCPATVASVEALAADSHQVAGTVVDIPTAGIMTLVVRFPFCRPTNIVLREVLKCAALFEHVYENYYGEGAGTYTDAG